MPFCERCGKQLANGQICNCNANPNNGYIQPPPPPLYGPPPIYDQTVSPNPQNQKSNVLPIVLIIAIPLLLIVLVIIGILAAIFVPTFIGYTNKSKLASQNTYSSSMYKAINSALTEMDEEGYEVGGNYFICSDASKNFCYSSDDTDMDYNELNSKISNFFTDSSECKWFAIIEHGCATYVASAESWDSEIVGTYPHSTLDAPKGYSRTYSDKQELRDMYDDTIYDIYYY